MFRSFAAYVWKKFLKRFVLLFDYSDETLSPSITFSFISSKMMLRTNQIILFWIFTKFNIVHIMLKKHFFKFSKE